MEQDVTGAQQPPNQDQPIIDDNQQTDKRTVEELREALAKAEALTKSAGEEAKKYRQTVQAIKAEKEAAEKAKLEAEGNWKAIAEKAQSEAKEAAEKIQKANAQFAFTQIRTALEVEAAKHGCKDTKALIKLVDLSDVEVDDSFMPNLDKLKAKVDQAMKERDYLFAKPAPGFKDLPPNKSDKPDAPKSIDKMTDAELEAALRIKKN